jgi:phosphoribosyl 1,2-cyclic phosphate phosphodiesterase
VKLHFLGTGTSAGVPLIGCACATCGSGDPRDRRGRHGAVVESDEGAHRLLVDTPPELRLQLLQAGITDIDAVWFTHEHADHVHGIDDVRVFSARHGRALPAYAGPDTAPVLRERFRYIFDPDYRPPEGTTAPELRVELLTPDRVVEVGALRLQPLPLPHGESTSWGFRVGALGYVTDAKHIPPAVAGLLAGVRVLVLNALWFGRPHPTHFNMEEAIAAAASIGAERTYLTHLTHRHTHEELLRRLPPGVEPAWDGLTVEI